MDTLINKDGSKSNKQKITSWKPSILLFLAIMLFIAALYLNNLTITPILYFKHWDNLMNVKGVLAPLIVLLGGVLCLFKIKSKDKTLRFYYLTICIFLIAMSPVVYKVVWELLTKDDLQTVGINSDTVIFNDGEVGVITAFKLDWLLFHHKGALTKAKMSGPGGNTTSAYYIKYRLQNAGITETIAYGDECNSSCTILWTAGVKRYIEDELYLGFHSSCSFIGCERKAYLYDGFLIPNIVNIINSPNSEHACPIGSNEIKTLEGEASPEKDDLIKRINAVCLNKGLLWRDFQSFTGY